MRNTPAAYAAISVLHRPVESATQSGHCICFAGADGADRDRANGSNCSASRRSGSLSTSACRLGNGRLRSVC